MHEAAGLAAEAQRELRGRQPMLDHQLQRVESLVVIDLGSVGGADARRQRLGPLEENGFVAPFVERERELQMLVADDPLRSHRELGVKGRRRETLTPDMAGAYLGEPERQL